MTTEGNTATRLDWERLGALFQRVHELAPEERRAFIERETACEPRLRDELVALLEADLNSTSPISRAVGSALLDAIQHQRNAMVGRVVGSYRLVSILGQGGTGTV